MNAVNLPARVSRLGRKRLTLVTLGLVAVATGVVVAAREEGAARSGAATTSGATTTATIERRDLVDRASIDGKLGYPATSSVDGSVSGTLTWLPDEGAVLKRGSTLYRVDGTPVVLFYGGVPAWRTLSLGVSDGADVRQLERNLVALGYDPDRTITVDNHFSSATAAAVRRWQDDIGLSETGQVDLGRVVFRPGEQRVGEVQSSLGGQAAGPVLQLSSTRRVVTANVDAAEQSLVRIGAPVIVELPTGARVRGRITKVSRVAQADENSDSGAVIPIEIGFGRRTRLPNLDQAPVTVEIARESKDNALSVPITALLAQAGGQFAVEVVRGGRHTLVPVTLGLFADGYVEISGAGLKEGTTVVVAE